MIIIHHNKDMDGFCSGAVCKLKYPEARLIGWDYKDPIPDFKQFKMEDIIMIDITFPIDKLLELASISRTLTVIDHHISFKKDFELSWTNEVKEFPAVNKWGSIDYIYKDRAAACEIGWEFLFPDKPIPFAVTLLGRYDTWRQEEGNWDEETLPYQYGMRNICSSVETFPAYLLTKYTSSADLLSIIWDGQTILSYQQQQDRMACERSAFEAVIDGHKAICLNTRAFSSNTMKSVYNPEVHDVMLGFEFTGTKWSVSLRGDKPHIDVSLIAKKRGGGGHKAAAGFETVSFEDIFDHD